MMNKKHFIFIAVASLLAGIAVFKVSPRSGFDKLTTSTARRDLTKEILVAGKTVSVETADTSAERKQGLSGRKSLCPDCGLFFVFDKPGIYPFWMRKMYFDIDILWIAEDRVVDITYGAKAPAKEEFDAPKTFYQSQAPVDRVLEVNAGWTEKNGIKKGDRVVAIN